MTQATIQRRQLVSLAVALTQVRSTVFGQPAWKPGRNVELVVGTNPGTGFDRTARVLQAVWKKAQLVDAPVTVIDKPGGAGVIAFRFAEQQQRVLDALTVIGPLLLTNAITRITPFGPQDLTPLCILLGEEIVLAVPGNSPIRSGRDLAEVLKTDPGSIAIALSGIGGQNHVTMGLVAQAVGAAIGKLKVVGFEGSGEAVTAAAGGHVDAVVGPASSMGGMLADGRLRGIGVAAEQRMGGANAGIPTWKEQGIPVVFSNWRGIAGPKSLSPAQVAWWGGVFARTVAEPDWKLELARGGLTDQYLDSQATRAFLAVQMTQLTPILQGLKLAP